MKNKTKFLLVTTLVLSLIAPAAHAIVKKKEAWKETPAGTSLNSNNNVGIGTPNPRALLDVRTGDLIVGTGTFNNGTASGDIYVTGNLEVDGTAHVASMSIAGNTPCTTGSICAGYQASLGFTAENSANKAAAGGYASLNGSSLVVQNPANATATPTASKIPIADGSGLLDGWITAYTATGSLLQLTGNAFSLKEGTLTNGKGCRFVTGTGIVCDQDYLTSLGGETDPVVKAITGIVKSNGSTISAAVSGTDYAPATSGSSILKGNGSGGFSAAVSGTDYAPATSGSSILKGNGAGGTAAAVANTDYEPALTDSASLATTISDESGTGALLFANGGTINGPIITLENGNGAAPTSDGRMKFDRTTERLQVGDGSGTQEFVPVGTLTNGRICTWDSATQKMVCNTTTTESDPIVAAISGLIKSNGSTISAAVSGTDYAPATSGSSILKGNGSGGTTAAVSGTDYAPATSGSSILKGNGSGGTTAAVSGTDYAPATSGSSILKGNGAGGTAAAVANTDYEPALTDSASLATTISDESGSGVVVFGTSPTITTPVLTLENGNGAAPTADGRAKYDRTTERFQVGDGSGTQEFVPIGTLTDTKGCSWDATGKKIVCDSTNADSLLTPTFLTQTANSTLINEQALSSLSSGIMRVATSTGVVTSLTDSAGIASNISDETGSGALVFGTSPTFVTSITSPLLLGGATTTSPLTLQSTSGVGAAGADIKFLVGNNGATEAMRILNNGNVGIGSTAPGKPLDVNSSVTNGIRLIYTATPDSFASGRYVVANNNGSAQSNGWKIGEYIMGGWSGSAVVESAAMYGKATGDWTVSSTPSSVNFDTTPSGSTTRTVRMTINQNGLVGIGTIFPTSTLGIIKNGSSPSFAISSTSAQTNDVLVVTSAGNVGIGTSSPQSGFQLGALAARIGVGGTNNNALSAGELYVQNDLEVDGIGYFSNLQVTDEVYGAGWNGSTQVATKNALYDKIETLGAGGGGFTDGGTNVYTTTLTDNVGIGTFAPTAKLHIIGKVKATEFETDPSNTPNTTFNPILSGDTHYGWGMDSDGDNTSNDKLYLFEGVDVTANHRMTVIPGGNIGIGTDNPVQKLEINGAVKATSFIGDGSALTGLAAGGGWSDGGTNVYTSTTTDNVGIGTTTPSTTLEIVKQSTRPPLMVSSTATGDGDYLIINSAGNVGIGADVTPDAVVEIAKVGSNAPFMVSSAASADGDYLKIDSSGNIGIGTTAPVGGFVVMNGNMGVGTWSPTQKLQVVGTVNATAFVGDGSGLTGIGASGWTKTGVNIYATTSTDRVGIGTSSPAKNFEVLGTAATSDISIQARNLDATGVAQVRATNDIGTSIILDSFGSNYGSGYSNLSAVISTGTTIGIATNNGANVPAYFYNGNVGLGTNAPNNILDILGADNTVIMRIKNNASSANTTGADDFINFNTTDGNIGAIEGSGSAGVVAYTTFTGVHWTHVLDKANLFDLALLCSTGDTVDWGQKQLTKTRVCNKVADPSVLGVYGGDSGEGRDQAMSIGTGYAIVANKGFDINVGDYLVSSDIPGLMERQQILLFPDNQYRNYTAARCMEPIKWKKGEKSRKVAVIYLGG